MFEDVFQHLLGPDWIIVKEGFQVVFKWLGEFIKIWWWVALPFIFYYLFRKVYLWRLKKQWGRQQKAKILQIKMPEEVKRPMKAMEQVFSHLWSLYSSPDFKDKWLEGKGYPQFSVEIASRAGKISFFIRYPEGLGDTIKSIFYSQYPDLELQSVNDYTKNVPQKIPGNNWSMWGAEIKSTRDDFYPIKTYQQFFEQVPETREEKKIDPLFSLLEGLTKLKKGEELWIQLVCTPITEKENNWVSRGKERIDEITKIIKKGQKKSILRRAFDEFFFGISSGEPVESDSQEDRKKISYPLEKEMEAIHEKISKSGFEVYLRTIYLGKDEVFFKPRVTIPINFFTGLSTENLNGFRPSGKTSVDFSWFKKKRVYIKSRAFFDQYIKRARPGFPQADNSFVLNPEELATIFHFPSKGGIISTNFERIQSKKSPPPTNLPTE